MRWNNMEMKSEMSDEVWDAETEKPAENQVVWGGVQKSKLLRKARNTFWFWNSMKFLKIGIFL